MNEKLSKKTLTLPLADRQRSHGATLESHRCPTSKSSSAPPARTARPPECGRKPSQPGNEAPCLLRTVSAKSKTIRKVKKSAEENVVPKDSALMMAQMARRVRVWSL